MSISRSRYVPPTKTRPLSAAAAASDAAATVENSLKTNERSCARLVAVNDALNRAKKAKQALLHPH